MTALPVHPAENLHGSPLQPAPKVIKQLTWLAPPLLALPRPVKRVMAMAVDASLCVLSVWLAYYLRLGDFISFSGHPQWSVGASLAAACAIGLAVPIFIANGLYRAIFRHSGWPALAAVARAIGIFGLIYASVFTAVGVTGVPRTVGLIQPILLLLLVGTSRALVHLWLGDQYQSILRRSARPKVLIYGAGQTGRQLAAAMANSHDMQVAGFLDDDPRLQGHVLNGQPVYSPSDLTELASSLAINDVLLALPSIGRKRRNEILLNIRSAQVAVRTLPSVTDLAQGKVSVSDLRDLDADDLLGREAVAPDPVLIGKNIAGKVVLVTGAGGSIGSEICRQIMAVGADKLLLVEQSEFALYAIHQELQDKLSGRPCQLLPLLASVQDENRLLQIMSTWRPHTVYHAAAYKHVPLVEHNPVEGIRNNVFGTLRTAQAAVQCGVSDFILISTDKAVRPTNIMGASKRLAEMALQALAASQSKTRLSMVRFGNVLGSSGSVVPLFRQQIRDGGPITLTHSDITRYFMTIPEAAQLVIQAGAMATGGDVFVLDMGQAVKILDLAKRMVELSGLTVRDEAHPDGDIDIQITGLRPGEKLFEELLIGDNPQATSHPRIMKAHEQFMAWEAFQAALARLNHALLGHDVDQLRALLVELVAGYSPSQDIADWVHVEQGLHTALPPT